MEGKLYDEIYDYLSTRFIPGEEIPAEIVIKQILAGGYVPNRYGYQNMKEMFSDLSKIMSVKNSAEGKMMVVIRPKETTERSFGMYTDSKYRTRRGSGEIGLLSGKSLDDDGPSRKQALPEDYEKRLPENRVGTSQAVSASVTKPATEEIEKTFLRNRTSGYRSAEPQEPNALSEENRFKIYQAVAMGLQLEKPLYMSTLSPVLRYAGVEHDKLGFLKSKNMLKRCADFMDFEEVMMNGVPQTLVTVHHVAEWDEKLGNIERRVGVVLDAAEKQRIYDVLCEHMTFGEPVHMAAFSPILKTYGFDYRNYGFMKVKELASQLEEFLSLQEVMMNGVPQTLVTLRQTDKATMKDAQTEPVNSAAESESRPLHQNTFLPSKILGVLSRMTGQPVWACEESLEESYIQARNNGTLTVEFKYVTRKGILSANKERTMRFPLNIQTMRGDILVGELHETGNADGKPWFLAWVGSPERNIEQSAENANGEERVRELTDQLTDCCALSESVVRAAAFKAILCSEQDARRMIMEDYAEAFGNGTLIANGEEYYYPLRQKNLQGRTIYVLIAPNRIGVRPFYVRFIGTDIRFASQEEAEKQPQSEPFVLQPQEQPEAAPSEPEAMEPQSVSDEYVLRADNAPLPKELSELAFLPVPTVSLLARQCGMLYEQIEELLAESYRTAKEEGKISRRPDAIRFPMVCNDLKGDTVMIHLRRSSGGEQNWFLQYYESVPNKAVAVSRTPSNLEQFAFLGDWEGQLRQLAALAAPENWEYEGKEFLWGLRQYLYGAFDRIMKQDKMVYNDSNEMAACNTGLCNRSGYDIYALFSKNLPGSKFPWRFERFIAGRIGGKFAGSFAYSPLPPTYFDGRVSPWFETERNLMPLELRLVSEAIRILPPLFLRRYSNALENSLIEQMQLHPQMTDGCYTRLAACYAADPSQIASMTDAITRAVGYAIHRAKRDYAYVVPGYLPQEDVTVWMLPLTLQGDNSPDVVLAYTMEYGSYRPIKLLSMTEAYPAARFIRRMQGFWLTGPQQVQAESATEKEETNTAKE